LAECFDGSSVTIKNTTPLMIDVGSQGTSGPLIRTPESADAAGIAAAAKDKLPFRLPPNYQLTVPVGTAAAAFSVQIAPDENRYFWMRYLQSFVPVDAFGDYEDISHFADSMNSIVATQYQCDRSASNFIYRAACVAQTATSVQYAVGTLVANLVVTSSKTVIKELRKSGLISAASKTIGLLISTAVTLAQSDASLFVDNAEESKFLSAPDILRISAATTAPSSGPQSAMIPVTVCNTDVVGGSATPQPSEVPGRVSTAGLGTMSIYTDSEGTVEVLAPSGWNCQATDGGDGNTPLDVWPKAASAPVNFGISEGIKGYVIPACVGCMFDLVCPLFPRSALSTIDLTEPSCSSRPPSTETDTQVNPNVVSFVDPPGVKGTWDDSANADPAEGIVYFNPTFDGTSGEPTAGMAVCVLPPADHSICTASLDDFVAHYGAVSVTAPPTTAPTPITQPPQTTQPSVPTSCPTTDEVYAAWVASPGIQTATPGSVTGFSNVECWDNWVIAAVVGNGNGEFFFSETGGLHGLTEDETSEFMSAVCTDPSAPSDWQGPDVAACSAQ
jgi:hypothetical protein